MLQPIRRIFPLATAGMIAAALAGSATSHAASTTTCKLTGAEANQGLGPSYVATATGRMVFRVRVTSCVNGKKVIRAYHACRRSNGGAKGRCASRVRGYSCTEKRVVAPSALRQFEADVTCRRGSARVLHHYTQRT